MLFEMEAGPVASFTSRFLTGLSARFGMTGVGPGQTAQ
jgi:hypothetical protein